MLTWLDISSRKASKEDKMFFSNKKSGFNKIKTRKCDFLNTEVKKLVRWTEIRQEFCINPLLI